MTSNSAQTVIISVLLDDRVGILADVTGVIFKLGGDIGGIQQTLVDGFFNLAFSAKFSCASAPSSSDISIALTGVLGDNASISVRIVESMPTPVCSDGEPFFAITKGEDRPGTIYAISSFFVRHFVNIQNWQVDYLPNEVVYVAQVMIPRGANTVSIQRDFRDQMALHGLSATLSHENIFRATNEICPIASLIPPGRMRVVK